MANNVIYGDEMTHNAQIALRAATLFPKIGRYAARHPEIDVLTARIANLEQNKRDIEAIGKIDGRTT